MAPHGHVITLREKELVFDFVGARHGQVFDDHTHGTVRRIPRDPEPPV